MEKFYVKSKTRKRWDEICDIFQKAGVKWANERNAKKYNYWEIYKENSKIFLGYIGDKSLSYGNTNEGVRKVKFKNLKKELGLVEKVKKEEIDWENVPVDTKVIVTASTDVMFRKYFKSYGNGSVNVFRDGKTSFSSSSGIPGHEVWDIEQVKIYKGDK